MRRFTCVLMLAVLASGLALAAAMPASAHSELEGADPEPNAHLKAAPSEVRMTFTEEPSTDSIVKVTDGCDNSVAQRGLVDDHDFVMQLATGQPGKWNVSFKVISAEDGHLTKGTYSFEVAGKKDCSPDKGGNKDGNKDGKPSPGGGSDATNDADEGDFPVVPVVIAAVVLVIVGVIIRRASAR